MRRKLYLIVFAIFLLGALGGAEAYSQPASAKSVNEIKDMIKRANSEDDKVSEKAIDEVSALTADSIPNLFKILKEEGPCDAFAAAGVITHLKPDYPGLVPAITKLVRHASLADVAHMEKRFMCRRQAAYLLPFSAEGLRSILEMLNKGDTWEKQTAIFALDDFTEVGGYNDRAGEVDVMKEIIPALATLQNSKDQTISDMSREILGQIADFPPKELADLAKKLIVH